jgi:hypothetical protein
MDKLFGNRKSGLVNESGKTVSEGSGKKDKIFGREGDGKLVDTPKPPKGTAPGKGQHKPDWA